jgi:hypothetical protein
MISTVTTSTVTILTVAGIAGSLALIGILVLISLLVQKEMATAAPSTRLQRLSRALNIGILPLLIAFGLIVIFKVLEVLK